MKMLEIDFSKSPDTNYDSWGWPIFKNTLLAKHYVNNNKHVYSSEHEGLTFDYKSCENIIYILKNNENIKDDLFNYDNGVEEFALQSICMNSNNKPFILLGNGPGDFFINHNEMNKCLYKIPRYLKYINNYNAESINPENKILENKIIENKKIRSYTTITMGQIIKYKV